MTSIPLGRATWQRRIAYEPEVFIVNRFFEQTPTNQVDNYSMLLRPTLSRRTIVGDGPVRAVYQQDGVFDDDLWAVSAQKLFRVHRVGDNFTPDVVTEIEGFVAGDETPSLIAAYVTGGTQYLWIADGFTLQYYAEGAAAATGTLTFIAQPMDGDTFTIGTTTYTFRNSPVNPTDIAIGGSLPVTVASALASILANSTDVTAVADPISVDEIDVTAAAIGPAGNTIATTATGTAVSWGGDFLFGGRNGTSIAVVPLPDDVSAVSLDYIKGFIIVTVGTPFSQRFYWINPGDNFVDPLNFAEAESSLDPVLNVKTISDQFWLFGSNTTEAWYVTGDPDAPMAPISGRPYNRGIWGGTAVKVNDSVILVGQEGRVYDVSAGPNPISYPGIEERIRRAMREQEYGGFA